MVKAPNVFAVGLVVAVSGCATEPLGILDTVEMKEDTFVATGARRRVVTNSELGPESYPGYPDPLRIVCTEPSPDVAMAVANSFGAGVSVLGQGSGTISNAQVQSMAQLVERTASIQLLRDKMYQTCLAYSNGAITGTTYSLVMSKLDDTIVSLLLGETAGGAFGRKLAALGGEATAESRATLIGLPKAVDGLTGLTDELNVAQKNVDEKQAVLREKKAVVDNKETPSQEEKDAVTKAESDLALAKVERDEILKRLQSRAESISEATAEATFAAGGGLSAKPSPLIADTLSRMQEQFLSKDFTDFFVQACMIELGIADGELAFQDAERAAIKSLRLTETDRRLRVPSALAAYCITHLDDTITRAMKANDDLRDKRVQVALKEAGAREAVAKADAERAKTQAAEARTAALKEFKSLLETCNGIADVPTKNACIGKLPTIN